MGELKTNLVIIALLALVLILASLVVITSEVLHPTAQEGSFIDKYIIPHTEEQVSIQEEEMEVIGEYKLDIINIIKIHDNKDNVTCWINGYCYSGISCIPDHQLTP